MQQPNKEVETFTKKAQADIAKSFVKKAGGVISKKVKEPKTIREGLNQTFIEIQKEGISLKRIEKTFLEIEKNLKAFRVFSLGVVALTATEMPEPTKRRAGRRVPSTASRVEEKVKPKKGSSLLGLIFRGKVKKRPPTKIKTKTRPPRKTIKASTQKKNFNKKLRNVLTRLKAKIKQRSAKLRGIQRYRAGVEASRVQRRLDRLKFKQEARLARQRLLAEQNRRIAQAEADSRRIRTNADADARRIRANAQTEAARRIAIAEADAKRIASESQTRARALIADAESQSRQRIAVANQEVNNATQRVQQINEDVRRLETRRQQAINEAGEAQRVVREAQAELKRVQADTSIAESEKTKLIQRQQELIQQNNTIRNTFREEATKLENERLKIQAQISEAEGRVNSLRNTAESLERSERRRIQSLVSGGEVPRGRAALLTAPQEPSRVPVRPEAPSRVVTEVTNRLSNQTSLTAREIQAIVGERNVQAPATRQVAALLRAPNASESLKRTKQIAVLLSKPPVIRAPLNQLTSAEKIILQNAAQRAVVTVSKSVVTTVAKQLPVIGLIIGAGFTLKSAVIDRTKVGTALNAFATLTKSFPMALATIYPLTINEAYKDRYDVYPEYDPDPEWYNKLWTLHVLMWDEIQASIKKIEKSYNNLLDQWERDIARIRNRGVGAFIGGTFNKKKPGPREEREQQRLMRSMIISSSDMNQAIARASARTGVDPRVLHTIAMIESSGGQNLKNPNSSATGLFQFTSGTWEYMKKKHPRFKDILDRGTMDFDASAVAAALYIQDNSKILQNNGVPINIETLYAAHFLGPGSLMSGAVALYKLLETNPNDTAEKYFRSAAQSNKEIFYRESRGKGSQLIPRTIAEVVQVLRDKINVFASSSERAFPTVGTGNQIQKTSELIDNNQTRFSSPRNIVILNNNTTVLGAKQARNPYIPQFTSVG